MTSRKIKQMGIETKMKDQGMQDDSVFSEEPEVDVRRMSQRELYVSRKDIPSYDDLRSSRMVSYRSLVSLLQVMWLQC